MSLSVYLPVLISFFISVSLGPVIIPFLKRLKAGQTIRGEGPRSHLKKNGTPTMGGILILSAVVAASLFYVKDYPQIMPVLLLFYVKQYVDIDAVGLFISIIQIIIIPIVLGLIVNKVCKKQMPVIQKIVPLFTVLALLGIILVVVALNVERLQTVALMAAVAMILYTVIGLIVGFSVSRILRMPQAKGKAMTFVIGVQNTALAVTLGITYFDPLAAIPGAIGVVFTTVFCSFIASLWGNRTAEE